MTEFDNTWYNSLNKSILTPPNIVFRVVWPILYLMMGVSFLLYINAECTYLGCILFYLQLAYNITWSKQFFGDKNILNAYITLNLLCLTLTLTIYNFYYTNKTSAYLLIPYYIWCLFALYLNYYILKNN